MKRLPTMTVLKRIFFWIATITSACLSAYAAFSTIPAAYKAIHNGHSFMDASVIVLLSAFLTSYTCAIALLWYTLYIHNKSFNKAGIKLLSVMYASNLCLEYSSAITYTIIVGYIIIYVSGMTDIVQAENIFLICMGIVILLSLCNWLTIYRVDKGLFGYNSSEMRELAHYATRFGTTKQPPSGGLKKTDKSEIEATNGYQQAAGLGAGR